MSDLEGGSSVTPGQMLRQAREASGMHVGALAVALKVPVAKLEALEADRLEVFPDAVFVRALTSSVCRTLRVDAAPILARLPQSQAPKLDVDEGGLNASFRTPMDRRALSFPAFLRQPMMWAVGGLCIGALAIYFWPHWAPAVPEAPPGGKMVSEAVTAPAAEAPESRPESAPVVVEAKPSAAVASPSTMAPAAVAAAPSQTDVVGSQSTEPVGKPPAPPVASPVAPEAVKPALPPAQNASTEAAQLTFSATGVSWIKVTDGRGAVVFQKTLASGESAAASGTPPLAVVVGKADVTQVQVRGKPFDLAAVARENVARFEVK